MTSLLARACVLWSLAFATVLATQTRAEVPQLINYEGRVAVNGVNFKGLGQFKFALVDAGGTATYWSNDGSSTAGSEPIAAVTLTVTKGRYSVLLGDPTLPNMMAVPAEVFTHEDLRLRVWFNDGSNGSQLLTPDQPIGVPADAALAEARGVRNGGAATTDAWQRRDLIPRPTARSSHTAVWTGREMIVWGGNDTRYLNDGGRYDPATDSWTTITTIGAPAARSAYTAVWTGSEMIIWGGQTSLSSYLGDGGRYDPVANHWMAVTTTGAPTARGAHTAVWTGHEMIVWGGRYGTDLPSVLSDGGRYNPAADSWTMPSLAGAPVARSAHTAVWTGTEMVVWGGQASSGVLSDGGRYTPAADIWGAVTPTGAPADLFGPKAVWTGSEMIVLGGAGPFELEGGRYDPAGNQWTALSTAGATFRYPGFSLVWTGREVIGWGGGGFSGLPSWGGRFDPASNTWTLVTTTGAPLGRSGHSAVWTGSEMIVWGGGRLDGLKSTGFNNGGRYNPTANSWRSVPAGDAPTGRYAHTAVWTGSEMIVWGGAGWLPLDAGGRYDPAANRWTRLSTAGGPPTLSSYTSVWTGHEMIVWGRISNTSLNGGARYDPVADSWAAISTIGSPAPRLAHTAVWTGDEMIIWGGLTNASNYLNDGGRYDPVSGGWAQVTTMGAPAARASHTAVWTGSEMIIWGGGASTAALNSGGRYNPAGDHWTPMSTAGAPAGRSLHTAVWTGNEMIVWGGPSSTIYVDWNDGGRYNPSADSWTLVPTTGAPGGRHFHTAVWTGTEMIIWGGYEGQYPMERVWGNGGRYNPVTNGWTAMTTAGAPAARLSHTAVWTGTEMIVWGGRSGFPPGTRVPDDFNDTFSYTPGSGALRILSAVRTGKNLILRFSTTPNCTYTLWSSDTLSNGTWVNTGLPAVTGTGAILDFTVPISTAANGFFRVQGVP